MRADAGWFHDVPTACMGAELATLTLAASRGHIEGLLFTEAEADTIQIHPLAVTSTDMPRSIFASMAPHAPPAALMPPTLHSTLLLHRQRRHLTMKTERQIVADESHWLVVHTMHTQHPPISG